MIHQSFAAGKGTALVIDVGHSEASVTPVVDGFVLRKGTPNLKAERTFTEFRVGLVHSSLPELVHAHAKHILGSPSQVRPGIDLTPHQLIASKKVRAQDSPALC